MSMEEEILEKSTNSVDDGGIRLSQIQLEFKLSKINTKLGYFDNILREFYFQKTLTNPISSSVSRSTRESANPFPSLSTHPPIESGHTIGTASETAGYFRGGRTVTRVISLIYTCRYGTVTLLPASRSNNNSGCIAGLPVC